VVNTDSRRYIGSNNSAVDTGQIAYPNYAVALHTDDYPMQSYNGSLRLKMNRLPPSTDVDTLPHQFRRYVNASGVQDVQLLNGLANGRLAGWRMPYLGAGWFALSAPRIPGQTRGDVAGFHPRGPSPLNVQQMWQNGPGSQPSNPGGPGRIAAPRFINPMTG
jgi:hypothetical protein